MGFKQHHFVLVHGGGHGAWCWVKIIPILEEAGHRVTAMDLASAGESQVIADDITTFQEYNQPLVDLFTSFPDDEKVILVGHSLGGLSIMVVSELFPKKISVAIYLAALMLPPGMTMLDVMAIDPPLIPKLKWKFNHKLEGGPPTSSEFTPALMKESAYNKCQPEDLEYALGRIKRWPFAGNILNTPVCTEEKYGSVPKMFVMAMHDKILPPPSIHKILNLSSPTDVIEIDADHSVFFSAPDILQKVLNDAAAKYDL